MHQRLIRSDLSFATAQLQGFLNFVGLHPTLAIAAAFLGSAGEALPTILGAVIGVATSYWTGRIYKDRLVEIWRFSRHHGLDDDS
jgi:membrane protein DedA with SNARE-associated domain